VRGILRQSVLEAEEILDEPQTVVIKSSIVHISLSRTASNTHAASLSHVVLCVHELLYLKGISLPLLASESYLRAVFHNPRAANFYETLQRVTVNDLDENITAFSKWLQIPI
jgi:hypothetical protein